MPTDIEVQPVVGIDARMRVAMVLRRNSLEKVWEVEVH